MQGLKILVVAMGVAIVAGVVVLAAVILDRLSGRTTSATVSAGFGEVTLGAPAGARIAAAHLAEGRLVVVVDGPDGGQVVILDPASGERLGEIRLAPPP